MISLLEKPQININTRNTYSNFSILCNGTEISFEHATTFYKKLLMNQIVVSLNTVFLRISLLAKPQRYTQTIAFTKYIKLQVQMVHFKSTPIRLYFFFLFLSFHKKWLIPFHFRTSKYYQHSNTSTFYTISNSLEYLHDWRGTQRMLTGQHFFLRKEQIVDSVSIYFELYAQPYQRK